MLLLMWLVLVCWVVVVVVVVHQAGVLVVEARQALVVGVVTAVVEVVAVQTPQPYCHHLTGFQNPTHPWAAPVGQAGVQQQVYC
jgi:hypothetical protein